jgi:hypothetical protein
VALESALVQTRAMTKCVALVFAVGFAARAESPVARVTTAAQAFLATLDEGQREKVVYAFDDDQQRANWSNLPTGFVPRGGINLRQMTPPQREAAMKLLATVLSPAGLEKVNQIRAADDDFKANGSRRGPPRGPPPAGTRGPPPGTPGAPPGTRGPPPGTRGAPRGDLFGSDLYYVSFVGTPSTSKPWLLQFGGHHLALNITVSANDDVLTPSLTGAQPATFKLNGKTIRPLGRESDKALLLLQSLDEGQRKEAVLDYRVADLVLGPGQDGKKIAPEGLKTSRLNEKQRALLLDLVGEWAGIVNQNAAAGRMEQLKGDLDQTWFAWSGATSFTPGTNITAYYRIQGPHLVIEYAPQRDEPGNHIHTIYRDPTNDYGRGQP